MWVTIYLGSILKINYLLKKFMYFVKINDFLVSLINEIKKKPSIFVSFGAIWLGSDCVVKWIICLDKHGKFL